MRTFFQIAHSDATFPIIIGTLAGSVNNMANSKDVYNLFKSTFKSRALSLWWVQPRSESSGQFTPKTLCEHYNIDHMDM